MADPLHDGARRRELLVSASVLLGGAAFGAVLPARAALADRLAFWANPVHGFNVGTLHGGRHDAAFFLQVAATGARLVRLFVPWLWQADTARYALLPALRSALGAALRGAHAAGLSTVLVGEFETSPNPPLWGNATRRAAFAQAWRTLALELSGIPGVAGYDLLNEPNPPWSDGTVASAQAEWQEVASAAIQAIRQQDSSVPIVFEGIGGGQAVGLKALQPLAYGGIIYSLHFYTPHALTHQHVSLRWQRTINYPDPDEASLRDTDSHPGPWHAARLRSELQDAINFQHKVDLPLFVGEFSCVRWAPGASALNYLRDCIQIFNSQRWSWAYHEFRGWPGWDAEISSHTRSLQVTAQDRSANAPVMRMLREQMGGRQR